MLIKDKITLLHCALDELNYHPTIQLDFDEFNDCTKKTICRIAKFSDLKKLCDYYDLIISNWDFIERLIENNHERAFLFKNLEWKGSKNLKLVANENANGVLIATNILKQNQYEFDVFDQYYSWDVRVDEKNIFINNKNKHHFTLKNFDQNNFVFEILNSKLESILKITCSNHLEINLIDNKTNYVLSKIDKNGYFSLINKNLNKKNNVLAKIFSYTTDEKEFKYGISQILILEKISKKEADLIVLIGIAAFLSINAKMKEKYDKKKANENY